MTRIKVKTDTPAIAYAPDRDMSQTYPIEDSGIPYAKLGDAVGLDRGDPDAIVGVVNGVVRTPGNASVIILPLIGQDAPAIAQGEVLLIIESAG